MTRSKNDLKNKSVWDCIENEDDKSSSSSSSSSSPPSSDSTKSNTKDEAQDSVGKNINADDDYATNTSSATASDLDEGKLAVMTSTMSSSTNGKIDSKVASPEGQEKEEESEKPDVKDVKDSSKEDIEEVTSTGNATTTLIESTPVKETSTKQETNIEKVIIVKNDIKTDINEPQHEEQQDGEEEEEEGDQYELVEIISSTLLRKDAGPSCNVLDDYDHGPCPNKAALIYVNKLAADDKWHYCLDCQDNDYGGWPELNDMPVKFIADAHLQLMKDKCSCQPNPSMPVGLIQRTITPTRTTTATTTTMMSPGPADKSTADTEEKKKMEGLLVTPPPDAMMAAAGKTNTVVVAMARVAEGSLSSSSTISSSMSAGKGKDGKSTTAGPKKKEKISKETQAAMKKWRATADKLGGKGLPLRLKADQNTKEELFNVLKDTFRPHTVTEIHNDLLKGTVPGPVLQTCLGAMSMDDNKEPFADDDDSHDEDMNDDDCVDKTKSSSKNKKEDGIKTVNDEMETQKDPFKSSLIFKAGAKNKNGINCVYYVDYKLLPQLSRDERDELMNKVAQAENEKASLQCHLKKIHEETNRLNSEPKNDELEKLLVQDETKIQKLEEQVKVARQYLKNEKDAQRTKTKIQVMTSHWRKRKKLCHEFLVNMEELSDGSISRKKALNGDGALALDSDEQAVKATLELHRNKRQKLTLSGKAERRGAGCGKSEGSLSNPNFVAVILNSQHQAQRVYLDEETGQGS